MATPRPPKVVLSEQERAELERLVRAFTTGQQLALRARIVLLAGEGWNNLQIARELGVDDETPGHWRRRWLQFRDVPLAEVSVAKRLADAPKCGAPAKFTPEQVCQIIALACEKPADSNRPISQWSHRELADEIVQRVTFGIEWRSFYSVRWRRLGCEWTQVRATSRGAAGAVSSL